MYTANSLLDGKWCGILSAFFALSKADIVIAARELYPGFLVLPAQVDKASQL